MLSLLIDILEAIARSPFHWLIWNRVLKIDRRMMMSPRYARLHPSVNSRKPEEFGCEAYALFTVFGWGWVLGWRVVPTGAGRFRCPRPTRKAADDRIGFAWATIAWREPQTPWAYKVRVFGRIDPGLKAS